MSQERYHGLDFVRAIAMLLGVILHVTVFFMPADAYTGFFTWAAGEYHGDVLNYAASHTIHLFRMQLFFLMAGFFAELVIERKGMLHLAIDRSKRILIPFLAGAIIGVPVLEMVVHFPLFSNKLDGMGLFEQFRSLVLWGTFSEKPSFHHAGLAHYWFLYYLLIHYIFHALVRTLLGSFMRPVGKFAGNLLAFTIQRKYGFILLGALAFPFHYALPDLFFWPSGLETAINDIAYYALFYVVGAVLYGNRHVLQLLANHSWRYLLISIPFLLYIHEPSHRLHGSASVITDITTWSIFDSKTWEFTGWNLWSEGIVYGGWQKIIIVFIRVQLCWLLCFAFIGLAQRYLNRPSAFIRYLTDSAYWVFWIHLPITFGFSKLVLQMESLNSLTKCYLVLVASLIVIYGSYNVCVRYSLLGDYFMGKRKQRSDPGETEYSILFLTNSFLPKIALIGVVIVPLGFLLDYGVHHFRSDVIIESCVARNRAVLHTIETIDRIEDKDGNSPLHYALVMPEESRRYNTTALLIEKTSRLDLENRYGRTALFQAVRTGNIEDAKLLVESGADMHIADKYGHTPAHVAAIKTGLQNQSASDGYYEILMFLVAKGADITLKDYKLRSVSDCLEQFANRRL